MFAEDSRRRCRAVKGRAWCLFVKHPTETDIINGVCFAVYRPGLSALEPAGQFKVHKE